MKRSWMRWLPSVAATAVVAGAALVVPLAAHAAVDLPAKSPQQVLELAASSTVSSFSGTIEQTSDLGLPQLPSDMPTPPAAAPATAGSGSTQAAILELVTGSHTARVYADGPKRERVQVLDKLAERDAIRNGDTAWFYDSSAKTATHVTLPTRTETEATPAPTDTLTPPQLAKRFLAAVTPSTTVSLGDNTNVAGQNAYDLVLAPKATDTLVSAVSIVVDADNGLPLGVTVTARGQSDSAFSLAFSTIDLSAPDASLFSFTPPAGVKVTQQSLPALPQHASGHALAGEKAGVKPTVTGSGWDAIVSIPASAATSSLQRVPLYAELSTPVAAGGLVHTSLVNILITTDGRVLAGSVPAAALESAASAG